MSEMLSDMAHGKCCAVCADYFQKKEAPAGEIYTHGYAVVCLKCWGSLREEEKYYTCIAKVETIEERILRDGVDINNLKLNAMMLNQSEGSNNQFEI